jgi:hypothetical protein
MLHLAASISRLGTESAFEVLARAQKLAAQGQDIINLGIGQPDFRTPDHIVEAGIKALRDGHHGYTPANGIPALREAVAADLAKRHGVEVSPDHVVAVPGGKPTMFFAVLMFGEPGAEIMYPNPGFPIYESVIKYSGATPVPIALEEANGFAFSAEAVLAQITPRTRLIIINSPANPTGGVTPKKEIDRLVAGLQDHPHVAVLSDEIYSQMLYDGREHVSLLQYPEIRLAAGLCGVAFEPGRSCDPAVHQRPFLRERGHSTCRGCCADRPAGRGARHGLSLRRCRWRLLRLPQHRGHRAERARGAGPVLERGGRRHCRRHQLRCLGRGLSAVLLRQQYRQYPRGGPADQRMFVSRR